MFRPVALLVFGLAGVSLAQVPTPSPPERPQDTTLQKSAILQPNLQRSFATPTSTFRICLVGKDWALVAEFSPDDFPYRQGPMPLTRTVRPVRATLHTGPDVGRYIHPPAGPPAKPIPSTEEYAAMPVEGLLATLAVKERLREPDAHVLVKLSGFMAKSKVFGGTSEVRLPLRGPYP
jgi:hypothetical protein